MILQKMERKSNTTYQLRQNEAMKKLSNDRGIVIKEADKGGATVIMDSNYYLEKVETVLNDENYYEELNSDPHKEILRTYKKINQQV